MLGKGTSSAWKVPPRPTVGRYNSPIINYGGGGWMDSQIQEPCIFEDPTDPTKLRMYMAAMGPPVALGQMTIGYSTAFKNDPRAWSTPVQLITDTSRRLDSVVHYDGLWYVYSSNMSTNSIDLFTSEDGITNWTATPDVLTPTGQGRNDGDYASQGTVVRHNGTWYMIYSYRNGGIVLPGYRYATSPDGVTWTKGGSGDILSTGTLPYSPDLTYMEWKSITQIDGTWLLVYESFCVNLGPNGSWSANLATAPSPEGPWTKGSQPILMRSGVANQFDQYFVATPAVYEINGEWWIFYQGGNGAGNYNVSNWSLGAAKLSSSPIAFL